MSDIRPSLQQKVLCPSRGKYAWGIYGLIKQHSQINGESNNIRHPVQAEYMISSKEFRLGL